MTEDLKKCTKCGESKPLSEFNKQKAGKNGYNANCRECSTKYRDRRKTGTGVMQPWFIFD